MAKAVNPMHNPYRPNIWGMLSQVIQSLIEKGQLLMTILGIILIIAFSKMTTNQIYDLSKNVITMLGEYHLLGWASSALLTPTFIYFYSKNNKLHKKQIESLEKKISEK